MKLSLLSLMLPILVTSLSSSAFAGEWISAGNAPPAPTYPTAPVNYLCKLTVTTRIGAKSYRIEKAIHFANSDFQPPGAGIGSSTVAGETDPGMNGQWISLKFSPKVDGGDTVHLIVGANIKNSRGDQSSTLSYHEADCSEGSIEGTASLDFEPKNRGARSQSVTVSAVCAPEK